MREADDLNGSPPPAPFPVKQRRPLAVSRAASMKAWRTRKRLAKAMGASLAAQTVVAWDNRPGPTTVRRVATRIDPGVRIIPNRPLYRFRVYEFSDGSRLRTRGQGYHFLIVTGG
jgi:hypothetical protein